MLNQDEAKYILDTIMSVSTADETEACVSSYRSSLTRFAESRIHQNVSEDNTRVSVTATLGKRMGDASTNKVDRESIEKVVADATEIARFTPPDDELQHRLGPQVYPEVQAYDPSADKLSPMDRARAVAEVVELCEDSDLKAAGAFSSGARCLAIANSNGLFALYHRSNLNFSTTALGSDGSGWASRVSHRRDDLDTASLAEIAVDKALKSRRPREVPPGDYTVILEPEAVADLLYFMQSGFNALAVDEGRSFLAGKMGEKVVGDNISLMSDPYHPLHQGRPFDGDGVPTKRVVLIEDGLAANLVYDRQTAGKKGAEPTGHGVGGRNSYGAYPTCLTMKGGEATLEDMISSTDRGILVTRFWYMNVVDPMKVTVTGMTRDGTFWIENGNIAHGIKNFRINQNVLEMLTNVEMMSEPTLAGGMVVPAIKAREFSFTSGTDAV